MYKYVFIWCSDEKVCLFVVLVVGIISISFKRVIILENRYFEVGDIWYIEFIKFDIDIDDGLYRLFLVYDVKVFSCDERDVLFKLFL